MTKLVLILSGIALAGPVLADTPIRFERDGITYVGTVAERDGAKYITGHEVGSRRAFNLKVAKGRVTGDYAGDYVSYMAPTASLTASR